VAAPAAGYVPAVADSPAPDSAGGPAPVRVSMLTREWPPTVYGGAGVHVRELTAALARLPGPAVLPQVHCFADGHPDRPDATTHTPDPRLSGAFGVLSTDLVMAEAATDADVLHSHTWYAQLAGHLAALAAGVPHVVTTHSLEPLRPWKAEQLGSGYAISSWAERTAIEGADAVVAVSHGMRADVLASYPAVDPAKVHVIYNGVDTVAWAPDPDPSVLAHFGIDAARPYVLFVGRVTRQKGLPHLLRAARLLRPEVQLVLAAGAADTPELQAEVQGLVAELSATRQGVVWIADMLPRDQLVPLLSQAAVFVCPSVYEPLGIVNLEAMACGTAVVASAVGGIPEVVEDGRTGRLVPYDPAEPEAFERGLAAAIDELVADPVRCAEFGAAGRNRAVEAFSWEKIGQQTAELYRSLL
jgi:alpha-maltose-1-phosphate synthase